MRNIKFASAFLLLLLGVVSCSKWDDYKQYTANGETVYTGKLDSVKVYSGRLRLKVLGLLPADPKITKAKITWNSGADSAVYSITKSGGIDSFNQIISVLEGVVNLNIQTFDVLGNKSAIVTATGTAYGPKYESGLINRPILNGELLSSGNAEITWDVFDTSSGAKGTWIRYTKTNNATDSVYAPVRQAVTSLPLFKSGTSISYRTVYLPNATCIDSFYTTYQAGGIYADVTSTYVANAGINFANSDGGTARWRTPSVWITTTDVRNGGNNIGGLDAGSWLPSTALSMEGGYGIPAVPNGKLYQTVTLPAGQYIFRATTGDCSDAGTKYMSVTVGNTPPDIANVPTAALAYKTLTKYAVNSIVFQLAAPTQVSIGFNGNLPSTGTYLKVFSVRLYSRP